MTLPAILAPVFVQVALAFALMLWMGRTRFSAVRGKQVRIADIALGERAWPAPAQQAANAYHNQFELPVLFYALVAFAILTRKADLLFVLMSWLFVATRIVHALIHTTSNAVMRRFQAFLVGTVILMLMWIVFAVRILLAGVAP